MKNQSHSHCACNGLCCVCFQQCESILSIKWLEIRLWRERRYTVSNKSPWKCLLKAFALYVLLQMDFKNVCGNTCRKVQESYALGQKWSFYVRVDYTFQMSSKFTRFAHDSLRSRQARKRHSNQKIMKLLLQLTLIYPCINCVQKHRNANLFYLLTEYLLKTHQIPGLQRLIKYGLCPQVV